MKYQDIRYEVEEPNAIITIDRPERLNAFRGRTIEELIHAFKRAWVDRCVACVIFTGAGERAFCVGGDQKQYAEQGGYGTSENGLW
ncbi:MAG: enoyl-CoA hydratase/isomerase family protein, partial [Deltaproteobacteria bacterium]|nr:enoyl-CoA hydratase/isomerase family protein [Deltaproteobacteria bacterium]